MTNKLLSSAKTGRARLSKLVQLLCGATLAFTSVGSHALAQAPFPTGSPGQEIGSGVLLKASPLAGFATASDTHWVFEDAYSHIWQIVRNSGGYYFEDITAKSGATQAWIFGGLTAFVTPYNGLQHFGYLDVNGHISEIINNNGQWSHLDLTVASGAPGMTGDAYSAYYPVSGFATSGDEHYCFFRSYGGGGANRHIFQIVYNVGSNSWGWGDITSSANAPSAGPYSNSIASFATSGDQHWIFQGGDNHIYQIVYGGGRFGLGDVTNSIPRAPEGAPSQGSFLTSFVTPYDQHWSYQKASGQIFQIAFSGTWGWGTIPTPAGVPVPVNNPEGFSTQLASFFAADGQHWIYEGSNGHVYESLYNGSWSSTDLTVAASALPAQYSY